MALGEDTIENRNNLFTRAKILLEMLGREKTVRAFGAEKQDGCVWVKGGEMPSSSWLFCFRFYSLKAAFCLQMWCWGSA